MDVRFAAENQLGKLAKWLRIFGYDTLLQGREDDRAYCARAAVEGRILLTRSSRLAASAPRGVALQVRVDQWEAQIDEVLESLSLVPDPVLRMTRCLRCNARLKEIAKGQLEGLVPLYVWHHCTHFLQCPYCGRIYWPGTHRLRMEEMLKRHNPGDRR